MKDKEEITYNAKGLVATWLNGYEKKDLSSMRFVCDGGNKCMIISCNVDDAGEKLGEILYKSDKEYDTCKLLGDVKGRQKEFGVIDIN